MSQKNTGLHNPDFKNLHRTKGFLCIVTLIIFLFSSLPLTVFAANNDEQKLTAVCDMDGDARITASDARTLLRTSVGLHQLVPSEISKELKVKVFGDLDADSRITAADARLLLRVSVKIETLAKILPFLFEGGDSLGNEELEQLLVPNTLLTPYEDHGLGKARMCVLEDDKVETMPAGVDNDKSHPQYSPLLKGTVDYVTGFETFGDDKRLHYALQSGRKIAQESSDKTIRYATLLENGYKMPINTLEGMTAVTGPRSTDVYIKTNWLVPMNVTFEPQAYYVGYDSRPWNLKSFTAEYMDIVFYHTASASGSFSFGAGSVISRGEWIQNTDGTTTLRLFFREKGAFFGYDISMMSRGYFKLSLKNESTSLAGKVIVLDAGHGAEDPGAIGVDGKTYEKEIALSITNEAARILRERGATIHMARTGDTNPSMRERTDLVRAENPDVFVSIHLDSASASAHGTRVFYYYPFAMPLAQVLQDSLVSAYKTKVYANDSSMQKCDLGFTFYPFNVARVETCPSVLIETGFLSNATELAALKKTENQNTLAAAIADGITEFLGGTASNSGAIG